jgi:hypothetical protein
VRHTVESWIPFNKTISPPAATDPFQNQKYFYFSPAKRQRPFGFRNVERALEMWEAPLFGCAWKSLKRA